MADYSETRRKKRGRARERIRERKKRRRAMVEMRREGLTKFMQGIKLPRHIQLPSVPKMPRFGGGGGQAVGKAKPRGAVWRDVLWHLANRTPFLKIGAFLLLVGIGIFILSTFYSGNVPPNVWALDTNIGGITVTEAESKLVAAWADDVRIDLQLENKVFESIPPSQLGLRLDARTMAEAAQRVGMTSIPFGSTIEPLISVDYTTAQGYLLNLVESVYSPPFEAGYTWSGDQLVGVPGRASRELDITLTLENLLQDPDAIMRTRQMPLFTRSTQPNVTDPSPYLADAYAFVTGDFAIQGYDPFTNEYEAWSADQETRTRWLAAGSNGLALRPDEFSDFVDDVNDQLVNDVKPRYLDEREVVRQMNEALLSGGDEALLRIRYLPTEYEVIGGDNGYRIGRKQGLPFGLIQRENEQVDWESGFLSPGDVLKIPSRDGLLKVDPVAHKRIIVDLETQFLVAYEDEEIVFSWPISSGMADAPTYPGIFQILSHEEVAYGSSFTLCSTNGTSCDQWEMYHFMGIYEVIPGLMNGFHGAVLLPNGRYLGGGSVGRPYTFGCVMSEQENAEMLFEWAEMGTMVEILSREFQPESDLGRQALEHIAIEKEKY